MKHISTLMFETFVSMGKDADFIPKVLELASKQDRLAFCTKELNEAIKHGWLTKALDLAEKLGRKLTEDEVWAIFKRLSQTLVLYDTASQALELLPKGRRKQGYRLIIKKAVEKGNLVIAQHATERIGCTLTSAQLEDFFALRIKEGRTAEAIEIAKLLDSKRTLTKREKEQLLRANISDGSLYGADEAVKLFGRRLSTNEIERLLRKQLDGYLSHCGHETAMRLPKAKRTRWLNRILRMYVNANRYEYTRLDLAKEVATRLGRKLTVQEAYQILLGHLKFKGQRYDTHQAAWFLIQRIQEGK